MKDLFGEDDLLTLKADRPKARRAHRRTTDLLEIPVEDECRRAFGVQNLLDIMGLQPPRRGYSYHIISGGNVDLIAHVRWLLLHFRRFRTMFISCWAIGMVDILLLKRWHDAGWIGDISLVVGNIYPNSYVKEWERLRRMYNDGIISRLYSSTIHSKLILLQSEDASIVVESSANCNMNPRVEQSVVTLSEDLYCFYREYFDELFKKEMYAKTNKELVNLSADDDVTTSL